MTKPFDQVLYDVHGNYRARKIDYSPPDQWVDDSLSWPLVQFHLIRVVPLLLLASVAFFMSVLLWITSTISGAIAGLTRGGYGADDGASPLSAMAVLLLVLAIVLLLGAIATLFLPYREPLAEYSMLIEGRAAAAASSYWWIWNAARQRQSPYQVLPARLSGQYFLTVKHGRDQVIIVVREVGADLFVGWNMWRSRSTMIVIGHYFRDLFANSGPGSSYRSSLRNSHTRALREAGHSLLREGVQAAIYGITPGSDTLQRDLSAIPNVDQMLAATSSGSSLGVNQTTPAGQPQQSGGYATPGYAAPPATQPAAGQTGPTESAPASGTGYGQAWPGNPPQNPS
jgi:hypothetical protein